MFITRLLKKEQAAFSLIELILAVAITAVISILLINILIQSNSLFIDQNNKVNQGVSLNLNIDQLSQDVKSAIAVEAQYPAVSPLYQSSDQELILKLPAVDGSKNIINQQYDYIVYYIDKTNVKILKRQIFPNASSSRKATDEVLMTNLKLINLKYYNQTGASTSPQNAASLNIIINTDERIGLKNKESSTSSRLWLRNN